MPWITLTEEMLLTRISGPELSGFRAAALGTAQEDPLDEIMATVTSRVRNEVGSCSDNVLGPDGTIPASLKHAALSLVVIDVMSRAAGVIIDPDGVRQKAAESAERLLVRTARCEFNIEPPDEASTEQVGYMKPSISARTSQFSREQQDGV